MLPLRVLFLISSFFAMAVPFDYTSYLNPVSFRDFVLNEGKRSSFLSFYHLNAQSLRNKEDHINEFIVSLGFEFDILAFTETWFNTVYDVIQIDGYNAEYLNRCSKKGGGVALYIKNAVRYEVMAEHCAMSGDYELLFIRCKNFITGVVYRPPSGSLVEFFRQFEILLDSLSSIDIPVVILGDFNIDLLKSGDTSVNEFVDLLSMYGFSNNITLPTRINASSKTLIDLCLTNQDKSAVKAGVLVSAVSDHLPLFCFIPKYSLPHVLAENSTKTTRMITKHAVDNFREHIASVNWNEILNGKNCDPNLFYNAFLEKIIEIYEYSFPVVQIRKFKKARKPWITYELVKRIKARDKLFGNFLKSRDPEVLKQYKKFRNKLNADIKKSRVDYYAKKFTDILYDPKKTWRTLKDLLRPARSSLPQELTLGDKVLSGKPLAEVFNQHFLSFGAFDSEGNNNFAKYMNTSLQNTMYLNPVTPTEIVRIIKNLKNSSACGYDGIKVAPIKAAADLLCNVICDLTNLVFSTGTFPDNMKIARVVVLHKGGATDCIGNYRPISILPLFSKIIEKALNSRLSGHLQKHNLLSTHQYGFQSGKSTESALLEIRDKIIANIENQQYTIGIFLDFNKAFDSIKHDILFSKLPSYRLRGIALELVRNYLSHRIQFVEMNDVKSDVADIRYGVPQGSILGPTLFLLYINDIVAIPETPDIVLYADDTNVFFSSDSISSLIPLINNWLESLSLWLSATQLCLNVKKTKYMVFAPINKPVELVSPLLFQSQPLEKVSEYKFLGVVFHENLRWTHHVNYIKRNIAQTIGMVNKYRTLLPSRLKRQLYFSTVHSRLHYCLLVWGVTSNTNMEALLRMQKRCIRVVHNLSMCEHTSEHFQEDRILPIRNMYKQKLSEKAFLEFNSNRESFFSTYTNATTNYMLRPRNLVKTKTRTNYGNQLLQWQIPNLLNDEHTLFNIMEHSLTMSTFRKKSKQYFLGK